MKHSMVRHDKVKTRVISIAELLVFLLLVWAFPVPAEEINTIHIVTPAWEGQTNEDGTGLFFDIVRSVYEPVGIKMDHEIVSWERAEYMVKRNRADAMLCVAEQNIGKDVLAPQYPMSVEYTGAVFKKGAITEWKGVESLAGKQVIWMRGYDFHKNPYMEGITVTWSEVGEHAAAWKRLTMGIKADVYIDSLADIKDYINTNNVDMTPYQLETLWGENAYMVFSNSERSKQLIELYDKRIIELSKSGELQRIFEKWDSYSLYPLEALK